MPRSVNQESKSNLFINGISILVPLVVALLLMVPQKFDFGIWTRWLPHINAFINSTTALLLITGLVAQKRKAISVHRYAMTTSFLLGAAFLVSYVTYHLTNPSTRFGGEGAIRSVYFSVLLSHIALSLVVLPLVLRTFFYAISSQFERHRRIARYAYPIWLYVSITGVIAYAMISPYYAH